MPVRGPLQPIEILQFAVIYSPYARDKGLEEGTIRLKKAGEKKTLGGSQPGKKLRVP